MDRPGVALPPETKHGDKGEPGYDLLHPGRSAPKRVKYPRTPHLPWSPGGTDDDKRLSGVEHLLNRRVVITEKMDGENTTMYRDHMHARSIDGRSHPSRSYVAGIHGRIRHEIPEGWRVVGENLYARHSVGYEALPDYFMVFSIWDENGRALSWDETVEWATLLGLHTVPVIADGVFTTEAELENATKLWQEKVGDTPSEGFVVRVADEFTHDEFGRSLAKWVREDHVQTDSHWMAQEVRPNALQAKHGDKGEPGYELLHPGGGMPPRPGTQPIPAGMTRAWTKVGAMGAGAPAAIIATEGLRIDKATVYKDQFGDFRAIWATIGAPDEKDIQNARTIVEFFAPTEEVQRSAGSLREGAVISLGRDVPPTEFVQVYEPWHGMVWMIQDHGGDKDWSDPQWDISPSPHDYPEEDWAKAIAYVRANPQTKTAEFKSVAGSKSLVLATPEAEATFSRWTKIAVSATNRVLRRQRRVITEKLSGTKARRGTRHFTPTEGKTANVTRTLSINDVWDHERWELEFAEEFAELASEVAAEVAPEVAAELGGHLEPKDIYHDRSLGEEAAASLLNNKVALQEALSQAETEGAELAVVLDRVGATFDAFDVEGFAQEFATKALRQAIEIGRGLAEDFPETADLDERARRRAATQSRPVDQVRAEIHARDLADAVRLGADPDATVIDSSELGIDETVSAVLDSIPDANVPLWRTKKPEWDDIHAEYQKLSDAGDTDAASALYEEYSHREQLWKSEIRKALGRGDVTIAEAKNLGYYAIGHDHDNEGRAGRDGSRMGWQPLPKRLFHVTTNASAVRKSGLKTREELNQMSGAGLGGGESDTISFTVDEELAHGIKRAILEFRRVARGEVTIADLLQRAREGIGASRPFEAEVIHQWQSDWKIGDPYPAGLIARLEGREINYIGGLHRSEAEYRQANGDEWVGHGEPLVGADGVPRFVYFSRPSSREKQIEDAIDFYKWFAAMRQHAGGPTDPLFFSSDPSVLAAMEPSEVQILEFTPTPTGQGYPLSGMGEWRTTTGDAVELVGTVKSLSTAGDLLGMLHERQGDDLARRQVVAAFIEAKHGDKRDPLYRVLYHPGPRKKVERVPVPIAESRSEEDEAAAQAAWDAVLADYPAIAGMVWKVRLGVPSHIMQWEAPGAIAYTSPTLGPESAAMTEGLPGHRGERNGVKIAVGDHVHNPAFQTHSTVALDPSRAVEIALLHELAHALDWARCKIGTPGWEDCARNKMIGVPVPLRPPEGMAFPTKYAAQARVEFLAEVFVVTRLFRDRFPAEDLAKWDAYIEAEFGWLKNPQMEAKIAQLAGQRPKPPLHPLAIVCDFGVSLDEMEEKHGSPDRPGYHLLHPGRRRKLFRVPGDSRPPPIEASWPPEREAFYRAIEDEYWRRRLDDQSHRDAWGRMLYLHRRWSDEDIEKAVGSYLRPPLPDLSVGYVPGVRKDSPRAGEESVVPDDWHAKREAKERAELRAKYLERAEAEAARLSEALGEEVAVPSLSDLEAAMVERAKREAKGRLATNVPEGVMLQILEDGRFKSQFETGETSSGNFAPGDRAHAETRQGVPMHLDKRLRPIYGYIKVDETTGDSYAGVYGRIQVIFKEEVRERTTVVWGDSYNHGGFAVPLSTIDDDSIAADDILSAFPRYNTDQIPYPEDAVATLHDGRVPDASWTENLYIEAQMHGGVKVDDIETILVMGPDEFHDAADVERSVARLREAVKGLGIEVRVAP